MKSLLLAVCGLSLLSMPAFADTPIPQDQYPTYITDAKLLIDTLNPTCVGVEQDKPAQEQAAWIKNFFGPGMDSGTYGDGVSQPALTLVFPDAAEPDDRRNVIRISTLADNKTPSGVTVTFEQLKTVNTASATHPVITQQWTPVSVYTCK